MLLQLDARQPLHFAAGCDAECLQLLSSHLADSPQFPDRQLFHERGDLFRFQFELPIRLFQIARDFRDQLVRPDAGGSGQFRFAKDEPTNHLRERRRGAGMLGHVEVCFIERERLDERRKTKQDLANHAGFLPVNIEPRR